MEQPGMQSQLWSKVRVRIKRYLSVIQRFWWLLLLIISLGICLAAWVVFQLPPAYESVGHMIMGGQIEMNVGAGYNEQQSNFYGTQIQLMTSGQVRQRALARVQTLHPDLPPDPTVDLEVTLRNATAIFDFQVTAQNAVFAQAYLDACMDEYIDTKRRLRQSSSDTTSVAISEELSHLQETIDKSDAAVLDFQKANNIGFMQEEGNSAAKYLSTINQQLSDLKTEYNLLILFGDDVDQNLDRQQGGQSAAPDSGAADVKPDGTLTTFGPIAEYQKARQEITLLKAQLADKSQRLRPEHPDIIALADQIDKKQTLIATLRSQSVEALKTHREDLRLEIQNLEGMIRDQEAKALDLSARLSEFERLKSNADRAKTDYDHLVTNMHNVDVTKNVGQDTITIMDRASQALSVKPGLFRIILSGIGGGLLVGILIVFMVDQFDDRVGSLMELQTYFPEPLLGQIPREKLDVEGSALLKAGDERQGLFESFRTLRSSIIFLPVEGKRPKLLAVTSALPNEGKTTVASNLAITLAFSGAKTLLVDADMRSGKVSKLFGADGRSGLSQILLQKEKWTDAVFMTSTDNLFILPCGPALHHTAEHLLGKVTDQFLRDIYEAFDYVVFDTPPVIILDDTLCLAPKIDATLFVVRFNASSVRSSRRALELLARRQTNVIGLVCNGVTLSETEYNYNYNYRRYYGGKYAEVKADNGA